MQILKLRQWYIFSNTENQLRETWLKTQCLLLFLIVYLLLIESWSRIAGLTKYLWTGNEKFKCSDNIAWNIRRWKWTGRDKQLLNRAPQGNLLEFMQWDFSPPKVLVVLTLLFHMEPNMTAVPQPNLTH